MFNILTITKLPLTPPDKNWDRCGEARPNVPFRYGQALRADSDKEKVPFRGFGGRAILICLICVISVPLFSQNITNNGDTIYISNGTVMTVGGNFSNLDNGTNYPYVHNEGTLRLNGDLSRSTNMIYIGNDTLWLSGSSTQSIAGLPYWYVSVTGGGNKTLTGDASIAKSMVLSSGTINTSVYTITLDSQATISEDASNYVTGKVQMTKYIPQSTNDTFGGMGLELTASNMAPGMTTVVRTTGSHLSGNGYQSVNRYFEVVPTNNGNTGSTITFRYFDGELNSLTESDLAIYRHRTNGKWEYNGYSSRNSSTNAIVASADTLGIFTAGSIIHPLPVELLGFRAILHTQESSLLEWQTASELNNDHFDVERSEDGKNFIKVGEVKGNGTTNTIINYDYIDVFGTVTVPAIYYRLKQVDYNGDFKYSEIRKVMLTSTHEKFKAWYNGSTNKTEAIIYYDKETKAHIRMIDIQGKLIAEQNLTLEKGVSQIQLDMYGLAQGMYTLYLVDGNSVEVKRVMKE